MECKACSKDLTGKRTYCDDACRMAFKRHGSLNESMEAMGWQPEQPEQNEPEQTNPNTQPEQVIGATVYGRQAVRFQGDQYDTRPMPLNPDDKPHSGGRGKYTRKDGSVYQFDCMGTAFDVTDGKVYQTAEEVRACYA